MKGGHELKKIDATVLRQVIRPRKKDSYKADYGRILCVGGNSQMGGAIIMAASACVHGGGGLVTVATDSSNKPAFHSRLPEAMWCDLYDTNHLVELVNQMDVVLIGPGMGRGPKEKNILKEIIDHVQTSQVLILDGDALSLMAGSTDKLTTCPAQVVLTPHAGEWKALSQLDLDAPQQSHQAMSQDLNSLLVLKGAPSRIFYKEDCWVNTTGNPAQATGGMGDCLAGLVAAFAGQFTPLDQAVAAALYLHSYIADQLAVDHYVSLPSQITPLIPYYMKQFEGRE